MAQDRLLNSFRFASQNLKAGTIVPADVSQADTEAAWLAAGGWVISFGDEWDTLLDGALLSGMDEFALNALVQAAYFAQDYYGEGHVDGYLLNGVLVGGTYYWPGYHVDSGDPTGIGAQILSAGGCLLNAANDSTLAGWAAAIAKLRTRGANEREANARAISLLFGFTDGGWPTAPGTGSPVGYVMKTTTTSDGTTYVAGDLFDPSVKDPTALYAAGCAITDFTYPEATTAFQQARANGADSETMDAMMNAFMLWWFN